MGPHNLSVRKTVTRDADRRSPERRAEVKVRMSRAQREALHRIAAARGETVAGLLLALVTEVVPEAENLQDAS